MNGEQWLRQHRGMGTNRAQVQWSKASGEIFVHIACDASSWRVLRVPCGPITAEELRRRLGNPFADGES